MSDQRIVLSVHGELPGTFCLEREERFLEVLDDIVAEFPTLRIVMEHLSTEAAVLAVKEWRDTVAATITVHHLELTLDDLAGDRLNPHYFCKPLVKCPHDREALLKAALSGNPKFFLGTDSAPHAINKKECACGCAGVYTAPVAMPVLAQIFEDNNALDKLEAYTSQFGAEFYGLPLNEGTITLVKEDWIVQQTDSELVPYKLGETLRWRVKR
jgi:dihydroorotase